MTIEKFMTKYNNKAFVTSPRKKGATIKKVLDGPNLNNVVINLGM